MKPLWEKDDAYRVMRGFLRERGFASDQIDSFDKFVFTHIREVIFENPEVSVLNDVTGLRHVVKINSLAFDPPSVFESNGTRRYVTPTECLQRRMSYTFHAKIHAVYTVTRPDGSVMYQRHVLNHDFDKIPCMKKSRLCNLNHIDADDAAEDEREVGGYFVINGQERVLIGQEQAVHNAPIVTLDRDGSAKLEIRSVRKLRSTSTMYMMFKPAYATEDETARRCVPGSVLVHIPFVTEKPDVAAVFRMLGVTDVDLMLDHVCAADDPPWFVKRVRDVLTADPASHMTSASVLASKLVRERMSRSSKSGETTESRAKSCFDALLRDTFLPQQGHETEDTCHKIHLFSDMLRVLLQTVYYLRESDNRDDYMNRRVALSASLLTLPFKSAFSEWRSKLAGALKHVKTNHVADIETLLVGGIGIPLLKACSTGNVSTGKSRGASSSSGVERTGQQLARIGLSANVSHIQRMCNPVSGQSIDARLQESSSIGVVDPHETPDTKECGLVRNRSAIAGIRHGYPHDVLVRAVCAALRIDDVGVGMAPRRLRSACAVYVSGALVGEVRNSLSARRTLRALREAQDLPADVSIFVDHERNLHVNAEAGSLYWPLIRLDRAQRLAKVLREHKGIDNLWDRILACGAVEYVNKDEENYHVRVAFSWAEVVQGSTHITIHPSQALSVSSSRAVLSEFNSAPRIVYSSIMTKPAPGAPPSNHRARFDTSTYSMLETHRPLVGTFMDDMLHECPVQNCSVAILACTGFSIEDSLIFNKASVERGMLRGLVEKSHRTGVHMGDAECEQMMLPPESASRQQHANYSKVDPATGLVRVGTRVNNNDILMSKVAVVSSRGSVPSGSSGAVPTSKVTVRDRSTAFKSQDEEATVTDVARCKRLNGECTYRVKTSSVRKPEVGCKFACLTAAHKVMCADGKWVDIADVTTDTVVACLNPETDTIEYHRPTKVHAYTCPPRTNLLVVKKSWTTFLEVTMDHRLCIRDKNNKVTLSCARHAYFEHANHAGHLMHCTESLHGVGEDIPVPEELWSIPKRRLPDTVKLLGFMLRHMQAPLSATTYYRCDKFTKFDFRGCNHHNHTEVQFPRCAVDVFNATCSWGCIPTWAYRLPTSLTELWVAGFLTRADHAHNYQLYDKAHLWGVMSLMQHAPSRDSCHSKSGDNNMHLHRSSAHDEEPGTRRTAVSEKVYCLTVPTGIFCVVNTLESNYFMPVWTGNSRHGQKGTCGLILPVEDMPTFAKSGIAPDIIVNPHAFPSRMTPGMVIEMIMGNIAVATGTFMDGTPFSASEAEEWGGEFEGDSESPVAVLEGLKKRLAECGMSDYGERVMFDGTSGKELDCLVFEGPCSMMRLNHDVHSKVHARARGQKVLSSWQAVEGRAQNGGNRFGEMEVHACVAHGAAQVVYDRHVHCSDKRFVPMCAKCKLVGAVGPKKMMAGAQGAGQHSALAGATYCHNCQEHNTAHMVPTPGGFHLLNHTLAAMHVKMKQELTSVEEGSC